MSRADRSHADIRDDVRALCAGFPDDCHRRIDAEGQGFSYILDGLNTERRLIAAECIGDGRWFIDRITRVAGDHIVFGRPLRQNQGVQSPIAEAHIAPPP